MRLPKRELADGPAFTYTSVRMKRTHSVLLACLAASPLAAGCATEQPFVWVSTLPAPEMKPDGVIRPRASLVAVVRDHADL